MLHELHEYYASQLIRDAEKSRKRRKFHCPRQNMNTGQSFCLLPSLIVWVVSWLKRSSDKFLIKSKQITKYCHRQCILLHWLSQQLTLSPGQDKTCEKNNMCTHWPIIWASWLLFQTRDCQDKVKFVIKTDLQQKVVVSHTNVWTTLLVSKKEKRSSR